MSLYVHQLNKTTLITHDGYVQLGIYQMSLEKFFSMVKVEYIETYWVPDVFTKRYKRVNYQKHLDCASIGTKDT